MDVTSLTRQSVRYTSSSTVRAGWGSAAASIVTDVLYSVQVELELSIHITSVARSVGS